MSRQERLNPSEDGVEKLKKRIPRFLIRPRSATQVKFADALIATGLAFSAMGGYFNYEDLVVSPKNNAAISRELEQYSGITQEQIEIALTNIQNFEKGSKELAQQGKIDQIPIVFDSQQIKESYELKDINSKRQESESQMTPRMGKGMNALFGLASILGFWGFSLRATQFLFGEKIRSKTAAVDALLTLRPDWKENPPTKEELIKFCRGLSYLPPVGGKIPLIMKVGKEPDTDVKKFIPSLTAEQQTENIVRMRQDNKLGDGYIHELTVQGRLPDDFKYAAIALILNSLYKIDWTKPFFEALWGKTSPLIHDGGNVEQNISPVWHKVKGRTDFLERRAMVHARDLEQNEKLKNIEEVVKLPDLTELHKEQEERNRLALEAKAYQRLALALHAQVGTAPKKIPQDIQIKLAGEWTQFQKRLDGLLTRYDIKGVTTVTWFREKPIPLSKWPGRRYEADWPPIQQKLIRVNEAKESNPEIRTHVTRLLSETTDHIDRIIGILPAIS